MHGYILSPLLSRTPRRHLPSVAASVLRALPLAAADASNALSFAPLEVVRTIRSVSAPALSLPPLSEAISEALPRGAFVAALSSACDARRLAAFQLAGYEDFKVYFKHSAKSAEPTYVKTFVDVTLGLFKQHGSEVRDTVTSLLPNFAALSNAMNTPSQVIDFVSSTLSSHNLYPSSPLAREFFALSLMKQLLLKPGAHVPAALSNLEGMRGLISEKMNSLWDATRVLASDLRRRLTPPPDEGEAEALKDAIGESVKSDLRSTLALGNTTCSRCRFFVANTYLLRSSQPWPGARGPASPTPERGSW